MAREGVCEERHFRIISVTTQQGAISRRVHRYKLALRDRQAAIGGGGEDTGILIPMAWMWNLDEE